MKYRKDGAFTLIELLVVVAIIAILAAIAIPNFLEAQTRAKIARAKSDMQAISTAMESYALDYHCYPIDWDSGAYIGTVNPPGEWMTYRSLSTPVAYLSMHPADPFSSVVEKKDHFYDYWCRATMEKILGQDHPDPLSWRKRGVTWLVYSYGPDLKDTFFPENLDTAINNYYDPSNGTVSYGDFGRCNTGPLPSN